ncbi:LysM peptidoglycan-binding domain-containing protein [bacterium]|nr:LysM peptidoglycan-binding domain-containing protein [bacterium]
MFKFYERVKIEDKIYNKRNYKYLDISDIDYKKKDFDIIIKKNNCIHNSGNNYIKANNPNNYVDCIYGDKFILNLAQMDEFKSVLNKNDLKTLNNDFKSLRKKDKNYDEKKNKERIDKIIDNMKNLFSIEDLELVKEKIKRRKTKLKFVGKDDKKYIINIKKDKIEIKVKENKFWFPKTLNTIIIDDNEISRVSKNDKDNDYKLTFNDNPEKFLKENKEVRYTTPFAVTNKKTITEAAEAWGIPVEIVEAANAPFKNIKGETLNIPARQKRAEYKYTVKEGESYKSIAKKLNIDKNDLINANLKLPEVGTEISIPNHDEKYKIAKNDTLKSIAEEFGVDLNELVEENNEFWGIDLLKKDVFTLPEIQPEQVITIPETTFKKDVEFYEYKVKKNETIEDVAKEHNVDIIDLKVANYEIRDEVVIDNSKKIVVPRFNHVIEISRDNVIDVPEYKYVVKSGDTVTKIANELDVQKCVLENHPDNIGKLNNLKIGQVITIPEHKKVIGLTENNFRAVAKETGVTESYIIDILLGIEVGRAKLTDYYLSPYDDNVSKIKKDENGKEILWDKEIYGNCTGTITVAYGRTNRVFGTIMTSENNKGIKINDYEAKLLLAQDILSAKAVVEQHLVDSGLEKSDLYELPVSVQEALIDLAYNKGITPFQERKGKIKGNAPRIVHTHIRDYLDAKAKNDETRMDKALVNIVLDSMLENTTMTGLKNRNLKRVYNACRDLTEKQIELVFEKLQEYYEYVVDCNTNKETKKYIQEQYKAFKSGSIREELTFERVNVY